MSRTAQISFAVMSIVWGGSYLLIEIAERGHLPALWVAWLRIALGAAALLAVAARRGTLAPARRRWRALIAYGVIEVSLPFPLIALAEEHVASSVTAIVIASVPLLGVVLAFAIDHDDRPSPRRAAGLGLGFLGVLALVGLSVHGHQDELLGILELLVAAGGYAAGPLILKHRLSRLDPTAIMGVSLAAATVVVAPAALSQWPARSPTVLACAAVVGLGLVCTALAFVVFAVLIREAGPTRATVITYVNPVVALALGIGLEGETPGVGAVAGLILILAGAYLATGGEQPSDRPN